VASSGVHKLVALVAEWVGRGQLAFANELRRVLHADAPELFSRLDFDNDGAFLEPTACAYAAARSARRISPELVWLHATPADSRRAPIEAETDREGRLFLPAIGYLSELPASARVVLTPDRMSPVGYRARGCRSKATSLAEWSLGNGRPTLLPFPVAAFEVATAADCNPLPHVYQCALTHRSALRTACSTLERCSPALASVIAEVVRYVVLFDDPTRNSFATPAVHGAVFLNVALGDSEAFFVEDLAHQGGHVILTAALAGAASPFIVPAESSVAELLGREDHRTLGVALHGMFTQALMVAALDRLIEDGLAVDRCETTGRLAFALVRLGLDLRTLAGLPIYSQTGSALVRELISIYTDVAGRYREVVLSSDFADQPYNFDYQRYISRNPQAPDVARA
jgi:hypothetical protein